MPKRTTARLRRRRVDRTAFYRLRTTFRRGFVFSAVAALVIGGGVYVLGAVYVGITGKVLGDLHLPAFDPAAVGFSVFLGVLVLLLVVTLVVAIRAATSPPAGQTRQGTPVEVQRWTRTPAVLLDGSDTP